MTLLPGHGSPSQQRRETFLRWLHISHEWEAWLADRWRSMGLDVVHPELRVQDSFENRAAFRDHGDLFVHGWPVEVKSKHDPFSSVHDYPLAGALLGSAKRWDQMRPKPIAFALISRATRAVVMVSSRSRHLWTREERYNRSLDVGNLTLVCPSRLLLPESAFVHAMLQAPMGPVPASRHTAQALPPSSP